MSRIYAMQLNYDITEEEYLVLKSKLSEEKQRRIEKFVFRKDALRSLVADLLVRYIICTEYQIPNNQIDFGINQYGKPFVEGLQSFHFNISHSGKWVVCATDNQPVGIDIEQIHPIDLEIADRFFSKVEIKDLEMKTGEAKRSYFFDLWSLKESYIKMEGKGLSIPLDSFSFRIMNNKIEFKSIYGKIPVYFKQYDLDPQYKLAVCQIHPYFSDHVQQIPLEEMISNMIYLHSF